MIIEIAALITAIAALIVALRMKSGPRGERGERGFPGPPGPNGRPGKDGEVVTIGSATVEAVPTNQPLTAGEIISKDGL